MDDSGEWKPRLNKKKDAEQINRFMQRLKELLQMAEDLEDAAAQFEKIPPRKCHQPRSSYKSSGVIMDDSREWKPRLNKEKPTEQKDRLIQRLKELLQMAEDLEDAAAQFEENPQQKCHQPRSSYKSSGVYMDDADERKPLLSKKQLAEQIEDFHGRIIEREQEYERRAVNLEDAPAKCCTIL